MGGRVLGPPLLRNSMMRIQGLGFETADAAKNSDGVRVVAGGAFCRGCDFAAHGGVSDFDQRNCDDALPRRRRAARADTFGILARGVWVKAPANRAGNFGGRGAFDRGCRLSGVAAKSA